MRKLKNIITAAVLLTLLSAFPSQAGWERSEYLDGGKKYKDDATGQYLTGWQELPWKDGTAWFCFGEDGVLYSYTITPDGYLVDRDGVWYEEDNTTYQYNWESTEEITTETGSTFVFIDTRSVNDFFPDYTETRSVEEFKAFLEGKGISVSKCSHKVEYDDRRYMFGDVVYEGTYYHYIDLEFQYKGADFKISNQYWEGEIRPETQLYVVDSTKD